MADVFCIAVEYLEQKALAQLHCFGDCGKIALGIIDTGDLAGPCLACCQPVCAYQKAVVGPIGTSKMDGSTIYIRALQERVFA
jgi:hypothetical protein